MVLQNSGPQWQFSMLQFLIRELPKEISIQLQTTIQRIAEKPNDAEFLEEIHILARETLEVIGNY
ncbi:hypothetical protein D3C81_1982860 [compost metagenome]